MVQALALTDYQEVFKLRRELHGLLAEPHLEHPQESLVAFLKILLLQTNIDQSCLQRRLMPFLSQLRQKLTLKIFR